MTIRPGDLVLVDTSIWITHLRNADHDLQALLSDGRVCVHPMIVGELRLGRLRERTRFLRLLEALPAARSATDEEVGALVDRHNLSGSGIGWIDAHLLAAALITPGTRLWTRDRALATVTTTLGCAWSPGH